MFKNKKRIDLLSANVDSIKVELQNSINQTHADLREEVLINKNRYECAKKDIQKTYDTINTLQKTHSVAYDKVCKRLDELDQETSNIRIKHETVTNLLNSIIKKLDSLSVPTIEEKQPENKEKKVKNPTRKKK
jgi:hypothetical protein